MKGQIMGKYRLGVVACSLALALFCGWTWAQAPAPAAAASRERIKMLDSIPGDAVAWVMTGNMKELCGKADAFVKDIVPKPMLKQMASGDFDTLKMLMEKSGIGETFNASGPLAIVLMEPKEFAPKLLEKKAAATQPADGGRGDEGMVIPPEVQKAGLPVLYILSGKDLAKMFPGMKVEADGSISKLTKDEEELWALEKDGLVFLSGNKKIVQAMPAKLSALARLTGGGEDLAARSDVMWWINRPRCDELKNTAFAQMFWRDARIPILSDILGQDSPSPFTSVIAWFVLTRDEVFRQGEWLMGGLTMDKGGPRVEFRVCCKPDGPMAKVLAAAAKAQGPLTTAMPDKPFIFAYGIRKDLFAFPPELETKQLAAMMESPSWGWVKADARKSIADLIQAVKPEVTGVQHWAGQIREDGPLSIATVVKCRDAEALKKIAKDHLPAIETMVNLAFYNMFNAHEEPPEEQRFKLTYEPAGEVGEGEIKADVIQIGNADLDKMLKDEDQGARMRGVLLKAFPGETKFRARLAVLDKNTLVITLGGGKKFLADTVAAAKTNASKLELSEDAKAALAVLPANRFMVAMVDIPNAVAFGSRAMMAMSLGMGGAQIHIKACPPIVVALSAEKADLVITAHVPAKLLKQVIGTITNMGEEGTEEEEEDKATTKPAAAGAAAGGMETRTISVPVRN